MIQRLEVVDQSWWGGRLAGIDVAQLGAGVADMGYQEECACCCIVLAS